MEAEGPLGVTAKSPKQETTTENVRQAGVQTGHCRGTRVNGEKLDLGVMVFVGGRPHCAPRRHAEVSGCDSVPQNLTHQVCLQQKFIFKNQGTLNPKQKDN